VSGPGIAVLTHGGGAVRRLIVGLAAAAVVGVEVVQAAVRIGGRAAEQDEGRVHCLVPRGKPWLG
jgi:hypothetical protein